MIHYDMSSAATNPTGMVGSYYSTCGVETTSLQAHYHKDALVTTAEVTTTGLVVDYDFPMAESRVPTMLMPRGGVKTTAAQHLRDYLPHNMPKPKILHGSAMWLKAQRRKCSKEPCATMMTMMTTIRGNKKRRRQEDKESRMTGVMITVTTTCPRACDNDHYYLEVEERLTTTGKMIGQGKGTTTTGRHSIYTTNTYHDTPPICIAMLLQKY